MPCSSASTSGSQKNREKEEFKSKLVDANQLVEKSRHVLDDVKAALEYGGKKLTDKALNTAEITLKGAGDEVEDFFAEVPNSVAGKVNTGFQDLLEKADQGFTWFLWNVVVPVAIFLITGAIIYLAVVSGCCACCCAPLLSHFGKAIRKQWSSKHKEDNIFSGKQVIILRTIDVSEPLKNV
ncbi:unnamed protein product [Anisakis simplex]|uniref:Uncharacterized protein n=1 Tax=Anisakis simplex TaxID=6269 RepID=A0A0M3JR60_ANISI|nr:unnamed protein product [Anisakis simplex]